MTQPPTPLDDRLPIVAFVPFRCPKCGACKPRTYGQRGRVRYHICSECQTRYRSLEVPPADAPSVGTQGAVP